MSPILLTANFFAIREDSSLRGWTPAIRAVADGVPAELLVETWLRLVADMLGYRMKQQFPFRRRRQFLVYDPHPVVLDGLDAADDPLALVLTLPSERNIMRGQRVAGNAGEKSGMTSYPRKRRSPPSTRTLNPSA